MNNLADKPLTHHSTGGRHGGGTILTEEGRSLIKMFRLLEQEHSKHLQKMGKNTDDLDRVYNLMRRISMRISAKNVFYGVLRGINIDKILAEVCLELKSGHRIYSVITTDSVETLGLVAGEDAYAVIKASSVLLANSSSRLSSKTRNLLPGRVVSVRTDSVTGEVILDIGGGDTITATLTAEKVRNLGLREGDIVSAVIDASNIIIGIE
jgi:molybdate transport system regulatory protein